MSIPYFDWLYYVYISEKNDELKPLVLRLFFEDFLWVLEADSNRATCGLDLREQYYNATGFWPLEGPCSFLEMVCALADRMVDLVDYEECSVRDCVFTMLKNAGFMGDHISVKTIVKRINDRTYNRHGKGSLFFCPSTKYNFRKLEIWYQMQEYVLEEQPIFRLGSR